MPFFKLRSKQSKAAKPADVVTNGKPAAPVRARWQSTWTSTEVPPDEIADLVHAVTAEMKLRAEALDSPFLLLPFRPGSDPSSSRSFIDNFFKSNAAGSQQYRDASLQQELRLTGPSVLCSILKWCWGRMPRGVVSWSVYETFKLGENESKMARNAFDTFVKMGSDSPARTRIIVAFFDLIATVAAHGKLNGLGGRKLSRLAGWWAFEHSDGGAGFEGGYKSWTKAADACSHLFFAYLRSLSPDTNPSMNVIERIPRSLQALLAQTEYPPQAPTLLQRSTPRVVMIVDQVSPTPFSLLRRAKHFEYREHDRVLREYSEFDDPVDALTEECKRVLYAIATTNSSGAARSRHGGIAAKPDETWSSFTSIGFGDLGTNSTPTSPGRDHFASNGTTKPNAQALSNTPRSRNADLDRPTTPSWGDFLSSGFHDEVSKSSSTMLIPPDKVLPPISGRSQTPSLMSGIDGDDDLTPGELAAITNVELDDAFWWVWMTSLAGEEPNARKAVFGRCALIETSISNGKWLIMEEQVKGASPDPIEGAQIVEKKSRFSFTRRGRLGRNKSTTKHRQAAPPVPEIPKQILAGTDGDKSNIGPDQRARIRAAAADLARSNENQTSGFALRRGQPVPPAPTHSQLVATGLQSEAGPAMKWANTYDKDTIRSAYLGSSLAGTGQAISSEDLVRKTSNTDASISASSPTQPAPNVPVVARPHDAALEVQPAPIKQTPAPPASNQPESPVQVLDMNVQPTDQPTETQQDVGHIEKPQVSHSSYNDSFAKEIGGLERKPIPHGKNADHPALRHQIPQEKTAASPEPGAAVIAARKALGGQTTAIDSDKSVSSKKQPGQSGLKKLFGRSKSNRRSADINQLAGGSLNIPQEPQTQATIESIAREAEHPTHPATRDYEGQWASSMTDISRVDSQEQKDAEIAFARFDQGPMEDMPSAPPRESSEEEEEVAAPPPVSRYNQGIQENAHTSYESPAHHEYTPTHERVNSDDTLESEATIDHSTGPAPPPYSTTTDSSKDRWERIRENAARRAAHTRTSEEQSTRSRPTESGRTDDGDTSGEETIESRVARIKARVAELTGNMDSSASNSRR